jgi:CRISPR system Cascade subunit CasE
VVPGAAGATLVRIRLNLRSAQVRHDLAHPTGLHQRVMLLAPDGLGEQPRQKAGLLFRLDDATGHSPPALLVQCLLPPDLARLPAAYGSRETRDLAPMLDALRAGRRVRYRITANPSVRRKSVDDCGDPFFPALRRHTDVPLTGEAALAWWQRKAGHAGLSLLRTDLTVLRAWRHPVTRTHPGRQPDIYRHALTRFDGLATITDPGWLRHAVLAGIGRGKPYGAGLLSLAPA